MTESGSRGHRLFLARSFADESIAWSELDQNGKSTFLDWGNAGVLFWKNRVLASVKGAQEEAPNPACIGFRLKATQLGVYPAVSSTEK